MRIVIAACHKQVNNRCPLSLRIDWWEIPPYIYKDENGVVSGIFPSVLKRLVSECCDRDPSSTINQDDKNITECVKLNFSETASNDSEVVKKNINTNGMPRHAIFFRLRYFIYSFLTGNTMDS